MNLKNIETLKNAIFLNICKNLVAKFQLFGVFQVGSPVYHLHFNFIKTTLKTNYKKSQFLHF